MSIPKKGSRKIEVANEVYYWLIRRKATHGQSDYGVGQLHVAIEYTETSGTTLIVFTDRKHPKDWSTTEVIPVTPSDIKKWIMRALELGWKPKERGRQFLTKIAENRMSVVNT